ncbi:CUS2 (YNL286W) [Zygosaccharomyces parabailii]|uniref:BN860_11606g1_1 n=1 Tax=Zygosaccharomyces bailii (strain CLIB 213 / ATCC 58445 / CBS 680 / BCRC 21525 / NBRC 1098 / NCYC 1416 / NRRL Y-2227) TaxID=1333698 RepID=A0A8J2T3C5_ZYGB2|nr:CUS2 (YNL286W) [Zygosaccharomyces parabailii]CDF87661.1 BN860_11606g1_1 [Zygosaccharomyces bailii CLIB 213]CDH15285.1 related to Cold sensitive U2 snRNA suppressor 2 [Zygosaccharomyces bailii ISA1307]
MEEEELALKQELKQLRQQALEKRRSQRKHDDGSKDKRRPSAIYLSNLCRRHTTEDQLIKEFSKFGAIMKDQFSKFRCKLYKDDNGDLKGDALIVYVRHESVPLAIEMMNGYKLNGSEIKVEVAQFENRKRSLQDGEENRSYKLAKKQDSEGEKNQSINCVVKIGNVLDLYQDFSEEELNDIEQDLLHGCKEVGKVKRINFNVITGEAEVQFENEQEARSCCNVINGRFFDGRKLLVYRLNEQDAAQSADETEESSHEDDLLEV